MFLNSINNYRAIAIVIIVAGHCYLIADISFNTTLEHTIRNLITGGTINFVFISGFLFHHIFYKKYKYNIFIINKVKRLLIPYTILSILPIILKLKLEPDFWNKFEILNGNNILNKYFSQSLAYYFSGEHLVAYWYIPFVMITFLLSPLHAIFIKLNLKKQLLITFLFFITSLFIQRPLDNIFVFHSVLYFTPIYLLGIICSIHKEKIYDKFQGKELYFLFAGIILAFIQANIGVSGNYEKAFFTYHGIDLMLLQKTSICLFFMVWLHRFEDFKNKYVNILASTSFTVFFLHGYMLKAFRTIKQHINFKTNMPWVELIIYTIIIVIISVLIALVIKKISPKYSKYITGY